MKKAFFFITILCISLVYGQVVWAVEECVCGINWKNDLCQTNPVANVHVGISEGYLIPLFISPMDTTACAGYTFFVTQGQISVWQGEHTEVINNATSCNQVNIPLQIDMAPTGGGSAVRLEPTITCSISQSPASQFAPPSSTPLINPLTGDTTALSIPQFVGGIIQRILGILGTIALVVFMYGAFKWITSKGESDDIAEGTHTMAYAAIGILVIFASYGILQSVIGGILGG